MATRPKLIVDGVQLGASVAQLDSYEVPSNTQAKIFEIILYNDHTSPVGVALYLVPNGGSAGVTNQIRGYSNSDGLVLEAKETRTIHGESVLDAGGQVHGAASVAAKVTIRISGIHITGT